MNNALLRKISYYCSRISERIDDKLYKTFRSNMSFALRPENLISLDNSTVQTTDYYPKKDEYGKIKIRIFHQQANMWNGVSSLYESLVKDDRYSVLIVITGRGADYADLVKQAVDNNREFVFVDNYIPAIDRPDIAVIYHPVVWPRQNKEIQNIRQYCKLIVSLPVMLVMSASPYDHERILFNNIIKPDICILNYLTYDILNENKMLKQQYMAMDNPSYDILYRKCKDSKIPELWSKLRGKKIVVWSTDHGLRRNSMTMDCAVDLYLKSVLDYFRSNPDFALVFRPHTSLTKELLQSGYWSVTDYNTIMNYFDNSSNLIWDNFDDYSISFSIADLIITDVNCSMNFSALLVNKPVIVLERYDMYVTAFSQPLTDNFYVVKNTEKLKNTLDMILRNGIDEKEADRRNAFEKYVKAFDGNSGMKVKQMIDKSYKGLETSN